MNSSVIVLSFQGCMKSKLTQQKKLFNFYELGSLIVMLQALTLIIIAAVAIPSLQLN